MPQLLHLPELILLLMCSIVDWTVVKAARSEILFSCIIRLNITCLVNMRHFLDYLTFK